MPPDSRRQKSLHTAASRTLVLVDHGPAAVVGAIRRDRDLRRAIGVADTADRTAPAVPPVARTALTVGSER